MMRATYAALAASLATLALLGMLGPVQVFAIAALTGLVRPSDLVMRNTLIGETMPAERLMGAMSISRTTADSARIAGALAGAGLVATVGMGPAYCVITTFYVVSLLLTLGVAGRDAELLAGAAGPIPVPASPWRDLGEAASSVWVTPHLLAAMCLAFLINLTAFPLSGGLLPYVAKEIYGVDQNWLGYLVAGFAFGGLVGSITLTRSRGDSRPARLEREGAV